MEITKIKTIFIILLKMIRFLLIMQEIKLKPRSVDAIC